MAHIRRSKPNNSIKPNLSQREPIETPPQPLSSQNTAEIDALRAKVLEMENSLTELHRQFQEDSLSNTTLNELAAQNDRLTLENAELKVKLEAFVDKTTSAAEEDRIIEKEISQVNNLKEALNTAKLRHEEANYQISYLKEEISKISEISLENQRQIQQKWIKELHNVKGAFQKQKQGLLLQLAEKNKEEVAKQTLLKATKVRQKQLQQICNNLQKQASELQNELQRSQMEKQGILKNHFQSENEIEQLQRQLDQQLVNAKELLLKYHSAQAEVEASRCEINSTKSIGCLECRALQEQLKQTHNKISKQNASLAAVETEKKGLMLRVQTLQSVLESAHDKDLSYQNQIDQLNEALKVNSGTLLQCQQQLCEYELIIKEHTFASQHHQEEKHKLLSQLNGVLLENKTLKSKQNNTNQSQAELIQEVQILLEGHNRCQKELASEKEQTEKLTNEVQLKDKRIHKLEADIATLTNFKTKASNELKAVRQEVTNLQRKLQQLSSVKEQAAHEIESLRHTNEQIKSQAHSLKSTNSRLQQDVHTAKLNDNQVHHRIIELTRLNEEISIQNSAMKSAYQKLEKQLKNIRTNSVNQQTDLTTLKITNDRLRAEVQGAERIYQQLKKDLSEMTQKQQSMRLSLEGQISKLTQSYQGLLSEQQTLQKVQQQSLTKLNKAEAECLEIKHQSQRMGNERNTLQAQVQQLKHTIEVTKSEYEALAEKLKGTKKGMNASKRDNYLSSDQKQPRMNIESVLQQPVWGRDENNTNWNPYQFQNQSMAYAQPPNHYYQPQINSPLYSQAYNNVLNNPSSHSTSLCESVISRLLTELQSLHSHLQNPPLLADLRELNNQLCQTHQQATRWAVENSQLASELEAVKMEVGIKQEALGIARSELGKLSTTLGAKEQQIISLKHQLDHKIVKTNEEDNQKIFLLKKELELHKGDNDKLKLHIERQQWQQQTMIKRSANVRVSDSLQQTTFEVTDTRNLPMAPSTLPLELQKQRTALIIHYEDILKQETLRQQQLTESLKAAENKLQMLKDGKQQTQLSRERTGELQRKIVEVQRLYNQASQMLAQQRAQNARLVHHLESVPVKHPQTFTVNQSVASTWNAFGSTYGNSRTDPLFKSLQTQILSLTRQLSQQTQLTHKQAGEYEHKLEQLRVQNQYHRTTIESLLKEKAAMGTDLNSKYQRSSNMSPQQRNYSQQSFRVNTHNDQSEQKQLKARELQIESDLSRLKQCCDEQLSSLRITPRAPYDPIGRAIWLLRRLASDVLQLKSDNNIIREQKQEHLRELSALKGDAYSMSSSGLISNATNRPPIGIKKQGTNNERARLKTGQQK